MKRKVRLSKRSPGDRRADCPLVWLWVRDWIGTFAKVRFCLDSGADVSVIPLTIARKEHISVPTDPSARGSAKGILGETDTIKGYMTVRIAGVVYTWPCLYIETTVATRAEPYGVLGREGFWDHFDFCVCKPFVTIQSRKPWTPFFNSWRREHDADDPL